MQICIDRISYEIKGWEAFWLGNLEPETDKTAFPARSLRSLGNPA